MEINLFLSWKSTVTKNLTQICQSLFFYKKNQSLQTCLIARLSRGCRALHKIILKAYILKYPFSERILFNISSKMWTVLLIALQFINFRNILTFILTSFYYEDIQHLILVLKWNISNLEYYSTYQNKCFSWVSMIGKFSYSFLKLNVKW